VFQPLVDYARASTTCSMSSWRRNFDWDGPLAFVQKSAGLSERVLGADKAKP